MNRTIFTLSWPWTPRTRPQGAQNAPLPPSKAAPAMKLPEGFRVSLFASEPDLVLPIAMTLDDRGRLWVAESHSIPSGSRKPN